jgi:hypothetical protein
MSRLMRRLLARLNPPKHCGSEMGWDVFRGLYVCHCGATR